MVALIAVGGVVLTQFVTYLISRQNANDLRVNISREIDIIRKLQPSTEETSKLEAHVRASVAELIYRDERREQLAELIWTFAPLILASAAVVGLGVWRQHGVPAMLGPTVAILYYSLGAISAWLFLRYLWGLLKVAYSYTRLGMQWTKIGALLIKRWWLNRKTAKTKAKFMAVIDITEDLLAAVEQAGGDDEQAQTARKEAAEEAARRLADIGVTLKSHPVPHY